MKKTLTAITLAAAFAIPAAWAATQGNKGMSNTTDYAQWEQMAFSDACMNGEVSATGLYPSQAAEDQSRTSM